MPDLVYPMLLAAVVPVSILMFALWVYQEIYKNAGVVDIGWGLGLAIMTWIYAVMGPGFFWRKALVVTMITIWAVRLSLLLIRRMAREKLEDKRYARLRQEWAFGVGFKFLLLFQFEVLLDLVLSIPFLIVSFNPVAQLHPLEILGAVIWGVGLCGEIIADEQLRAFKNDPSNKGGVCQVGLWNYSRHPNYFFEWIMWLAYFVFALASPFGWVAIIAPAIMLHFLINVTGIPFAEFQAIKSKGDVYRKYQATTSFFIPMPKKKD